MKKTATSLQGFAHLILLFVILLVAIGAGAWWFMKPGKVESQKAKYTGPQEKIRVANIGEFSIFNLIAKEKGFFTDNGLDAEVKEYDAGPSAMTALLKGDADFTVAAEFVGLRNIFTNDNIRILSQASRQKAFQVVARKDKEIEKESDLKGKKIGVTKKSAGEFYLGRFLTLHNLSYADVDSLDMNPGDIVKNLKEGTIDAAVTFNPHAYNLKKDLGDNALVWSAQGDEKTFANFYTTKQFIDAHSDLVNRYMQAMVDAENYLHAHPTESQDILAQAMHYDHDYVIYLWPNIIFALGLDQELLLTMEDQARWVIENKLTDKTKVPNYLDYMYLESLEKVKPESITVIR